MIRLAAAIAIGMSLGLTASTAVTDALVARCWWPGTGGACDPIQFGSPHGYDQPADLGGAE